MNSKTSRGAYFKKFSVTYRKRKYDNELGRIIPHETKVKEILMGFSHYVDQGDGHSQAAYKEVDLNSIGECLERYRKETFKAEI